MYISRAPILDCGPMVSKIWQQRTGTLGKGVYSQLGTMHWKVDEHLKYLFNSPKRKYSLEISNLPTIFWSGEYHLLPQAFSAKRCDVIDWKAAYICTFRWKDILVKGHFGELWLVTFCDILWPNRTASCSNSWALTSATQGSLKN